MPEKQLVYNLRNRNVKRMLWPVDHEVIRRDLKKEQVKLKKQFTEKYNFDFDSDRPLQGKYNWIPVAVGIESPISSPRLIANFANKEDGDEVTAADDSIPCSSKTRSLADVSAASCSLDNTITTSIKNTKKRNVLCKSEHENMTVTKFIRKSSPKQRKKKARRILSSSNLGMRTRRKTKLYSEDSSSQKQR